MSKSKRTNPPRLYIRSEIEGRAAEVKESIDSVTALGALYQGEKTEAGCISNTAMAMMGLSLGYMAGTILLLGGQSQTSHGWLLAALLPFPLWLVAAYHSLLTLNAMSHAFSLLIIEDALFNKAELHVRRIWVGSAAGDEIMDINKQTIVHKLTTRVVYGGVLMLVIGFTIYCMQYANSALKDVNAIHRVQLIALTLVIYSLLGMLVVGSWTKGLLKINRNRAEYDRHSCGGTD